MFLAHVSLLRLCEFLLQEKHKEIQSLHEFYKTYLDKLEKHRVAVETCTQTDDVTDDVSGAGLLVGRELPFSDMSTILLEDGGSDHVDSGCSPIRFDGGEEAR